MHSSHPILPRLASTFSALSRRDTMSLFPQEASSHPLRGHHNLVTQQVLKYGGYRGLVEMVRLLRALAHLPEDPVSIPNAYMVAHEHL